MNFRDFGKYNQFKEQFAGMSPEMKEQMMKMAKDQMKAKTREFVQKWLLNHVEGNVKTLKRDVFPINLNTPIVKFNGDVSLDGLKVRFRY